MCAALIIMLSSIETCSITINYCCLLCSRPFTDFNFLISGQLYPNNSVVTLSDIGSSGPSVTLYCLTPSIDCCSSSETPNADTVIREWYLPDGSLLSTASTSFTRGQVSSAVSLSRGSGGTSPTGVFRCDLPDANGTYQSLYVGIYPESAGETSDFTEC